MLSSSLDTLLKVSETTFPQKLFAYDCVTLYVLLFLVCLRSWLRYDSENHASFHSSIFFLCFNKH